MANQPREARLLLPPETWPKILISESQVLYLFTASYFVLAPGLKRLASFDINYAFICTTTKKINYVLMNDRCTLVYKYTLNIQATIIAFLTKISGFIVQDSERE